jgi:hypothetical protein
MPRPEPGAQVTRKNTHLRNDDAEFRDESPALDRDERIRRVEEARLAIDVEAKRSGARVEVSAIDKQRNLAEG